MNRYVWKYLSLASFFTNRNKEGSAKLLTLSKETIYNIFYDLIGDKDVEPLSRLYAAKHFVLLLSKRIFFKIIN